MDPTVTTPKTRRDLRRVGILFAGGPAPAANAVISTAAVSFLRHHIPVVGLLHGYSRLVEFGPGHPMEQGRDYIAIDHQRLRRTRNSRGIMIGTARTNPGKEIQTYDDLKDPVKTRQLRTVYEALRSIGVDALISIGGDDTLKSANMFARYQKEQQAGSPRIAVVHVPKTIDNDYAGIDFTFGYFTAVQTMASEVQNLLADAEATSSYYIAETMGRNAGWLAYGVAIAGEASLVIGVEDIKGDPELMTEETATHHRTGEQYQRPVMVIEKVVDRLINAMLDREREGKQFGVFVLAEGLAEYLPGRFLEGIPRDPHDHISIAHVNFGKLFAKLLSEEYQKRTHRSRKITGLQIGYEARCALPHAFDVILASQLGVGAFRALVEQGLDEVMISVVGQLNLQYVNFRDLIDPETMKTRTRYIERGSDFHRLARFLETYVHS